MRRSSGSEFPRFPVSYSQTPCTHANTHANASTFTNTHAITHAKPMQTPTRAQSFMEPRRYKEKLRRERESYERGLVEKMEDEYRYEKAVLGQGIYLIHRLAVSPPFASFSHDWSATLCTHDDDLFPD